MILTFYNKKLVYFGDLSIYCIVKQNEREEFWNERTNMRREATQFKKGVRNMARGPRKSLEEKIEAKQELIESLETRLESEKNELEEMLREKRLKELSAVNELIEESGLEPSAVADILKDYIKEQSA